MKHPIIISSDGEIKNSFNAWKSFQKSFHKIFNAPLKITTYLMSETDYQDILKWTEKE